MLVVASTFSVSLMFFSVAKVNVLTKKIMVIVELIMVYFYRFTTEVQS